MKSCLSVYLQGRCSVIILLLSHKFKRLFRNKQELICTLVGMGEQNDYQWDGVKNILPMKKC